MNEVHSRPLREENQPWSDENLAARFCAEIHTRFSVNNEAFRTKESAELEAVLRENPEKRGAPGSDVRDSGAWEIYLASKIRFDLNTVTIILPRRRSFGWDLVYMFDNTDAAWSRPVRGATIVDGEPRVTIEILLLAEPPAATEGAKSRHVLVELYETDVHALVALVGAQGTGAEARELQERLLLALEELP